MKRNRIIKIVVLVLTVLCMCSACAEERPIPQNPYRTGEKAANVPIYGLIPKNDTSVSSDTTQVSPIEEYVNSMSLEEKVWQMFIATPEQLTGIIPVTQSGEYLQTALETKPVGGIVLFADNIVDREQTMNLIASAQEYSKNKMFICVDEEGGTVARVANNPQMGTEKFPDMKKIQNKEEAYRVGNTIGTQIKELGFNVDFAPVCDVDSNPGNAVIGDRAFSCNAQVAADLSRECVRGLKDSGMIATLKHFPGHGDTTGDSHTGAVYVDKTLDEMEKCEFLPFSAGIEENAEFVMVGHIALPKVTGTDIPATLSEAIINGILRDKLRFDGIVITDSMQMGAITQEFDSKTAAVLAIKAGVDIILMPQDMQAAFDGIMEAIDSGEISEDRINESVMRIITLKIEKGIMSIN